MPLPNRPLVFAFTAAAVSMVGTLGIAIHSTPLRSQCAASSKQYCPIVGWQQARRLTPK